MNDETIISMTDEDWFNLGKSDAWAGKPKQPPVHDTNAASLYDLGYGEGEIKQSPTDTTSGLPNLTDNSTD